MSRRLILPLVVATMALSSCAAPTAPQADLCVVRPEDNGFANIVPVDLIADGDVVMTLKGGDRQCVRLVTAANHELQLGWRWDPRDAQPAAMRSASASITLLADGARRDICPDPDGRYPSWRLAPAGTCGG